MSSYQHEHASPEDISSPKAMMHSLLMTTYPAADIAHLMTDFKQTMKDYVRQEINSYSSAASNTQGARTNPQHHESELIDTDIGSPIGPTLMHTFPITRVNPVEIKCHEISPQKAKCDTISLHATL